LHKFLRNIPPGLDEICICAGDIGNPHNSSYDQFMNFVSQNFKKTFVIAGNHEYYSKTHTINETTEYLTKYFEKFDNITFLNNTVEQYEDHCFIGTTLWSKITNPTYEINDVYSIPNFDYIKYNRLNSICVEFLEDALMHYEKCIIITHHMPAEHLINMKYKTRQMIPYNQWFYCDMENTIETNKNKIKCWFYGHTHMPSISMIHDIPFLCNPIGYPGENSKIDFCASVDLTQLL
jgi:predicted phosphohydrolase